MKHLILIAALVLGSIAWSPAGAQGIGGGVFQSGPVTAGDCAAWKSAGVIKDAGVGACGGGGGGGTVTSVGLSLPMEFSCSGSPITGAGVITCGWSSEAANTVLAAPNGAPGTPGFRLLTAADIPSLSYVTSVALTAPPEFTVSGSPVTNAGTLALTKATQSANFVWAGPTTGAAAQPAFRGLVAADIPALSYVTSVSSANGDLTVATPSTTPVLTVVSAPKLDTGRTLAITGDLAWTSPSFDGSANVTAPGTLATVNANVGSFGDATHAGQFTVNGKGLVTAAASVLIVPAANTITLAMLAQSGANTMLGNWTGSTANVAAKAMPACADSGGNHLNYVSGTGITCGTTSSNAGTVTSVAQTVPAEFAIGGSPITTSGTLAITKATEAANTVWAGPTTGSPAQPAFRGLVAADIPSLSGVYLPLAGGTMTGPLITPAPLTVTMFGSAAGVFPTRTEATLSANYPAGNFGGNGPNSAGTSFTWAQITVRARVPTAGAEVGDLILQTQHGAAFVTDFTLDQGTLYAGSFATGQATINASGAIVGIQASPYTYAVPVTGFSITIGNAINFLILNAAGPLLTGTVTMPPSPLDGQEETIASANAFTGSLTIQANTGQTLVGYTPISTAANSFFKFKYVLAQTTWFRVN